MQAIKSTTPINNTPKSPTSPLKNRKTLIMQVAEPTTEIIISSSNAKNLATSSRKKRMTIIDAIRSKQARKQALSVGTFTFRPLKATFNYTGGIIENKPLFVKVRVGKHSKKTQHSEVGEDNPVWEDQLVLKAKDHRYATIKVKEHEKYAIKEKLGEAKLDLFQIRGHGKTTQWVKLTKRGAEVGELQIEVIFNPNGTL